MKNFLTLLFALLFVGCTQQKQSTLEQLGNLQGKFTFEEPVIEFYQWEKQDSSYIGAKYSIINGKDSLVELHSIQKIGTELYYKIDKVDTDFPITDEFKFVETSNKQHIFERNDSIFPKRITLEVTPKELTVTQQGQFNTEVISLPLVYNKQR